jgi:hypothetical protein
MAIQKQFINSVGSAVGYHRITKVEQYFLNDTVSVWVHLAQYTSIVYRELEKTNNSNSATEKVVRTDTITMMLPVAEAETLTRAQLYTIIMAMPEWEGSTAI